jgi:TP901 family phage tail tape measure protein
VGGLPPVFIEFLGSSKGVKTAMADVKAELATADEEGAGAFARTGRLGKAALVGLGIAAAAVAVKTVHMAADFETQMTRVRTGAGEAASNMKAVSAGILAMAGQVGESTSDLTKGLYTVESAGYHGAAALNVLKNSAEGARVGAADLGTVTDAVTTALNAYKLGAGQATQVTNALVGTEAEGKTTMEALAGSLSNILPTAAAAHVGLNEVLGAMATMTAQGTPATQAATYLRQVIGQLSNPSAKAATEMKNLGLSAVSVGQELGKQGLAATLTTITDAIQKHMGPAGTVLISKLQGAARNTSEFQRALADLPPTQQTYIGALATMVGGTKSMQAALELTGSHMKTFKDDTAGIADHVKKGGNAVEGWSEVQSTFNQRMAEAKASVGALGIEIGQYLLPVASRIAQVLATVVTWLTKHQAVAKAAAIVIGGALVVALVAATVAMWNFTAAALANPVVWIVVGIIALIAALVLLGMHWRAIWSGMKAVGEAVAHAAVAAWHWVADETAAAWGAITGGVTTAWRAVARFFTAAWHDVADPIVTAWRWVASITETVWGAIAAFFKRWWPLLFVIFEFPIAVLIGLWRRFHTQIEAVATTVWRAVAGFVGGVWRGIETVAGAIWHGIQIAIISPLQAVWRGIVSLWHTIAGWLSSVWHAIASTASSLWHSIAGAMTGPLTTAWHTITHTVGEIGSAIKSGLNAAWSSVKGIGSKFESIGAAIVHGIVRGVQSGASALYGSLKHLASGALSAAKGVLDIHSPSGVFDREVGQQVPAGAAQGVTRNTHLVVNAVKAMGRAMAGTSLALPTVSPLAGVAGAAGARSGLPTTAQVTTVVQVDGRTLFQAMQQQALTYQRRNTSNGLALS